MFFFRNAASIRQTRVIDKIFIGRINRLQSLFGSQKQSKPNECFIWGSLFRTTQMFFQLCVQRFTTVLMNLVLSFFFTKNKFIEMLTKIISWVFN